MALFTTFSFSSDRRLYVEAKRGKIGSSSIKLHSSNFAVSYAIFPIANRAYDKNKISFLDIICGTILFQNELTILRTVPLVSSIATIATLIVSFTFLCKTPLVGEPSVSVLLPCINVVMI